MEGRRPTRHPSESWDRHPQARGARHANSGAEPERRLDLKHSTRGPQKPPGYFTGCPKVPEKAPHVGDRSPGRDPGPRAFWYASIEKSLALVGDKAPGHDRQCSALSDQPACRADAGAWLDGAALRGIRGWGQGSRSDSGENVACGKSRAPRIRISCFASKFANSTYP